MKIILPLVGLLLLAAFSNAAVCIGDDRPSEDEPCETLADIVLLFDSSSSILAENYQKQFAWAREFVGRFSTAQVKFGAAIFSYSFQLLFNLNAHNDLVSLKGALTNIPYMNSSTYLHVALQYCDYLDLWNTTNGGRPDAKKILIILTDGNPNRVSAAYEKADVLKAKGIAIIGIAIGDLILRDILERIASSPDDVFEADNYDDLERVEQIVAERACDRTDPEPQCQSGYKAEAGVCVDVDECSLSVPICQQRCENTVGSYICSCNPGYVVNSDDTDVCDKVVVCTSKADIIFVFDASSSIGVANFEKQRQYSQRLVAQFQIGVNNVRIGAVVFSRTVEPLFTLTAYSTVADIQAKLALTPYLNSSTYLHSCLLYLKAVAWFDPLNGGRAGVPKTIILITDGNPNRVNDAIYAANDLKALGIRIVGVPIGKEILRETLAQIVSAPANDNIVDADDFSTLQYTEQRLVAKACGN